MAVRIQVNPDGSMSQSTIGGSAKTARYQQHGGKAVPSRGRAYYASQLNDVKRRVDALEQKRAPLVDPATGEARGEHFDAVRKLDLQINQLKREAAHIVEAGNTDLAREADYDPGAEARRQAELMDEKAALDEENALRKRVGLPPVDRLPEGATGLAIK